jgi:hypothetical protein
VESPADAVQRSRIQGLAARANARVLRRIPRGRRSACSYLDAGTLAVAPGLRDPLRTLRCGETLAFGGRRSGRYLSELSGQLTRAMTLGELTLGEFLFGTEPHWARVVMDRETEHYARSLDFKSLDAHEISGDKWAAFGFASYRSSLVGSVAHSLQRSGARGALSRRAGRALRVVRRRR